MLGFVQVSRLVDSLPKPAFTMAALETISSAALAQCDALDGVKDGVITRPGACRFDVRTLVCRADRSAACLTAAQARVVDRIYGARDGTDRLVVADYRDTLGTESWPFSWSLWLTGPPPTAAFTEPLAASFGRTYFQQMAYQRERMDIATIPPERLRLDGRSGPGRELDPKQVTALGP